MTIFDSDDKTRLPRRFHGLAGFIRGSCKDAIKQRVEGGVTVTVTVTGKGFDRVMTENFDFQDILSSDISLAS
jgi:hypothetical protein